MKTILIFSKLFLVFLLITTIACSKEGSGGKSNISGYVKHHNDLIPNAVVYLKYSATEFPGANTAIYDASVTAGADAHFSFDNLHSGNYYVYGVGYDNNIASAVTGGIAVKLKYDKTSFTDVPVTE